MNNPYADYFWIELHRRRCLGKRGSGDSRGRSGRVKAGGDPDEAARDSSWDSSGQRAAVRGRRAGR